MPEKSRYGILRPAPGKGRVQALRIGGLPRNPEASSIDYQCNRQGHFLIYAGPDAGENPGREVTTYRGHPVSHGACTQHMQAFIDEARARKEQ